MKRGEAILGTIIIVLLIIIFLGWLMNEGGKECRIDTDCRDTQYCASDFECHDFKVVEKIVKQSPSESIFIQAAWIIGVSLIMAAIIMKWDFWKKKKKETKEDGPEDVNAEDKTLYEDHVEELEG